MWSNEIKKGLLRHLPQATLADSFGSSEAVGMGASASTADNAEQTARFMPGPLVKLLIEEEDWREAGVGERGIVCQAGFLPAGYYKDQEKTDKTFRTIRGTRYSIPGDFAQRNEDGSITLLGRGSVCINTGGEKVFPEEVEEVLKRHPHVADAVCVGVPDERFGQAICALLEPRAAGIVVPADEASSHVRSHLAAYKAPRFAIMVESIGRAANGKVDYKGLTQLARERLGR
jgi:fatty-acyl-CoA synthase